MAWSAPMTAVANTAFTAAQFNTYVRDNFLETAPAKATAVSNFFAATGANAIAERVPSQDFVTNPETTSSTSYTDLSTAGPSVTVTTGTKALVLFGAAFRRTSASSSSSVRMSYEVSGATTRAADDNASLGAIGLWVDGNQYVKASSHSLETGLTPGSNTFTAKYRVSSGTGTWDDRVLTVIPF